MLGVATRLGTSGGLGGIVFLFRCFPGVSLGGRRGGARFT